MNLRDEINRQVIEILASKKFVPWQQPWTDAVSTMPVNLLTDVVYRDINPILLRIGAVQNGYASKWWGSAVEWELMGGKLRPDARGVTILTATGKPCLVFNLDGVEGEFDRLRHVPDVKAFTESTDEHGNRLWEMDHCRTGWTNLKAERIIKASGSDFREEYRDPATQGAFYHRPPEDYIVVPLMSQFHHGPGGAPSYYHTAFHELVHYTEDKMRWLADPYRTVKERYAIGEMKADLGAGYLCAACGIPPQKDSINFNPNSNFCRFVKTWLKIMEEDDTFIFRVAKDASDAVRFLLGKEAAFSQRASPV